MKIMIGIGHPKQVHIWKNVINILISDGHEIKIIASDKDITRYLLDVYGFDYDLFPNYTTFAKKALGLVSGTIEMTKIANKFDPDILVAGTPYLAYVSRILNKPHITLTDTERAKTNEWLTYPFTDIICTPACFTKKIDPKKHINFKGYFELAYLHPNYFKPDASILDDLNLDKKEKIIVVRFVGWSSHHDLGDKGFDNKVELINSLDKYGRVLITSERDLPEKLKKYQLNIPPEKIHHLLYYSSLFIGESGPMTTESAILGTPAIFVSTSRRGYTDELESRYDLVYNYSDIKSAQQEAFIKAKEILSDNDSKNKWQIKRKRLLDEKIDVSLFLKELIERYPEHMKYKITGKNAYKTCNNCL